MNKRRKTFAERKQQAANYIRMSLVALAVLSIVAAVLIIRTGTEASSEAVPAKIRLGIAPAAKPTPESTPLSTIPPQTPATRIRVTLGEKQELQIATGIDSFVLVSPEIASAEIKNRFTLSISGVKRGETILLVTYGTRHSTFVIEVVSPPSAAERQSKFISENGPPRVSKASGSSTTVYSQGFGGGPSALRQTFDYRQKLAKGRTLRISGEMFKLFGNSNPDLAFARVQDFALNRLSVGLDTPTKSIDILDSQVNISPLTLNNYTLRGFHLISTPKSPVGSLLPARGIEVFAGLARPAFGFFDTGGGTIAGAMVPLINRDTFQARAGFITTSPDKNNRQARGGTVLQAYAAYAPNKEIFADGEMSYAHGDLSWRARLDLRYTKYGASGEIIRFARSSPLNSVGAQPGGRTSETASFYWRPEKRLSTSFGYTDTKVSRLTNSQLSDYDRSLLFANANYTLTKGSRINLRYSDQKIESSFQGSLSKFQIETRTFLVGNDQRFNRNWSNNFEARLNFSRESHADAAMERGFSLNEQLHFGWHGGSVTGFVSYTNKTPSLTSLIVNNPQLLPPALQIAFALDPAAFLELYRDRLAFLLGGVELPQTRSFDSGIRFQKTFSRFTVQGETRYDAGEIYAVNQKTLYASASLGVRLDNSNSIQIDGWKTMGLNGQSGITVSYTHQIGSSDNGFQFSKLVNFRRSKVYGRVFYDLNGNGQPDVAEPGVPGIKIQIDGKRSVITDKDGRYELAANEGRHHVAMVAEELGVRLLADTPTEQNIVLGGGQKMDLNFGVRDSGSISGRIFNDAASSEVPVEMGLSGVRVVLHSEDVGLGSFVMERITGPNGSYEFQNLRPGKYSVEIDPASLPPNFQIPDVTVASIRVEALHTSPYDISARAQRAITGTVFIDKDGDGLFTLGKDETVEGASVTAYNQSSISGIAGSYVLRNLPAGQTQITVISPGGFETHIVVVELGVEPATKRSVNISLNR